MNAIIIAAGLGSRFKDITKTQHKALLPVGGVPNIERTIQYLQEFGIEEIYIVVGHLKESFYYLKEKYEGVSIIVNPYYREYNSIYTFSQVLDVFGDSYVIDGDVVLFKNIFKCHTNSTYYIFQRTLKGIEWIPRTNQTGRVVEMEISEVCLPSILGLSYWNKQDAEVIKLAFKDYMSEEMLSNSKLYWDSIPITILDKIYVTTYQIESKWVDEMDTVEGYENVLDKYQKICR